MTANRPAPDTPAAGFTVPPLRRLDASRADFDAALARLTAFDAVRDPALAGTVTSIIADVRARGDEAVVEYTRRFDRREVAGIADLRLGVDVLDAALAGLLAVGLALPFAWVATLTRSPLGTIGVLLAVVLVTQIVVVLGAGAWFPYAVPSLLTGMGGPQAATEIGLGSLVLTAALAPVAALAVALQWRRLTDV